MWRQVHRAYAFLFGYFWKPCPVCSCYFGGHEVRVVKKGDGTFVVMCPRCANRLTNEHAAEERWEEEREARRKQHGGDR
jgi:hypothetical protein